MEPTTILGGLAALLAAAGGAGWVGHWAGLRKAQIKAAEDRASAVDGRYQALLDEGQTERESLRKAHEREREEIRAAHARAREEWRAENQELRDRCNLVLRAHEEQVKLLHESARQVTELHHQINAYLEQIRMLGVQREQDQERIGELEREVAAERSQRRVERERHEAERDADARKIKELEAKVEKLEKRNEEGSQP